jgi:hypothetical protein
MSAITTEARSSGNVSDPCKKFNKVWGASVAGGVGFEPRTRHGIPEKYPLLLFFLAYGYILISFSNQ